MPNISRQERATILQALSAGAVPNIGLAHIRVGRAAELAALESDLDIAAEGGAAVRLLSGPTESGKTFLMNLTKAAAVRRGFAVAQAEASVSRRLYSTRGEARALFGELMKSLATKEYPEGIGLGSLIQAWITRLQDQPEMSGSQDEPIERRLTRLLEPLYSHVNGFDFATVLIRYYQGWSQNDSRLQGSALRWLRAEYHSPSQAQEELGVPTIIDDDSLLNGLQLFATFLRIAGYTGLLVNIDELGTLAMRIRDAADRQANFEVLRQVIDESLSGRMHGLMILCAIEKAALQDKARGLYSHDMLSRRLTPSRFETHSHRDLSSSVIWLERLQRDDYRDLLAHVRDVFAGEAARKSNVPDEAIEGYLDACDDARGPRYVRAPRQTVKDFVGMLQILSQQTNTDWAALLDEARSRDEVDGQDNQTAVNTDRVYREALGRVRNAGASSDWTRRGLIGIGGLLAVVLIVLGAMSVMRGERRLMVVSRPQVVLADDPNGVTVPLVDPPVSSAKYYRVEASFSKPCYAYVFSIDSNQSVQVLVGDTNAQTLVDSIRFPVEGSELARVDSPGKARVIVVLASEQRVSDARALRQRLSRLVAAGLPQLGNQQMVFVSGANTEVRPAPSSAEPDLGFVARLADEFSAQFDVVEAIGFVVQTPSSSVPTLGDMMGG